MEFEEIGCVLMRRSRLKRFVQRQTPGVAMNASPEREASATRTSHSACTTIVVRARSRPMRRTRGASRTMAGISQLKMLS
jgi:hypothetical protein